MSQGYKIDPPMTPEQRKLFEHLYQQERARHVRVEAKPNRHQVRKMKALARRQHGIKVKS